MSNILTILNLFNDAIFVSLVNTTLQMTLLIPLIALLIWMFRVKSATTRYSLWLFVIFGIIALPLLTPFISQIDLAKFYRQRAAGGGPDDLMRLRMGDGNIGESSEGGDSVSSMTATKTAVNKEVDVSLFNPVSVVYFIWCAVALFMFGITLDAYRKLRKLSISSTDVKERSALEMLSRLKDKLKVRRTVALKASSEIYTPVSLGTFSPTIILPDGVIEKSPFVNINPAPPLEKGAGGIYELEMILTHELAHIKRCDYLINFLQNMLRAIFFFHPLFHFVSRNLTSEREHICDDWVVDMTKQRGRYAECIIGLLEKALYQPVNVPVAIAMAERKRDIPRRIEMIMDKKRKITAKVSPKAIIAMFLIGFLALPIVGGIELVRFSGARPASNEGRIVFSRGGIWVMDADGKNETQLTTGKDGWPAWSSDGKQIAFARWIDEANWNDIYVMNAGGSNIKQLASTPEVDDSPTWSPDGKQIAFVREVGEWKEGIWKLKSQAIYTMNADGSNIRRLTESPPLFDMEPDWSPDGRKIVFRHAGANKPQIWVMDADGNNRKMLYDWGFGPSWSPDGSRIAFFSYRAGWAAWKSVNIYVMDADGSNVEILTEPGPSNKQYPTWSPDGTKIAFLSDTDGNWEMEIYVMKADGSNLQRLTNTPESEWSPDWTASSYGVEPAGKLKTTWGKIRRELFGK